MSTNFLHTNVGSADIAAVLQFQTVSDLFQTSLGRLQKTKGRISGYSCFPTVLDGFRPEFPYKCRISGYSCFPTVSSSFRPEFPYKCRIGGYSCFPTVSDGFRPVSDLFGTSTNFHTNVGSADIAAFLQFQTVSDLFRPLWDVYKFPYKCRISG